MSYELLFSEKEAAYASLVLSFTNDMAE